MAGDAAVALERRGGALWARLDRPGALNSIDSAVLRGLEDAMTAAEHDEGVRALVVTGTGRAFCAGADLALVESLLADGDGLAGYLAEVGRTFDRLEALPLPTIAAVNGFATAGGLELLLCCDLAVAAEDAKVGDAHANYGLLPGAGGTVRLPRAVGPVLAKRLMFTGALFPASELAGTGLLTEVVPAEDLERSVDDLVEAMARKSPLGLSRMKRLLADGRARPAADALGAEIEALADHAASLDVSEGLAAFREKREPKFTGT